jgi:cytochrome c-type biogenesis protein CcmF
VPLQVQDADLSGTSIPSLASLGRPSLMVALCLAAVGLVSCAYGAKRNREDVSEMGRRALYACAGFTALAGISLVTALFSHDFSLEYVVRYSSRSLSGPYTISALWGGMEGSLLFWTFLLTSFTALALRRAHLSNVHSSWAGAVLAGIAIFFLGLLLFPANPFAELAQIPADGQGLNPLLQSPGMMIHPPLLYTGFVGFSIPFAFAVAALVSGRLDQNWFTATRRWSLFAWSALSIGIVLGGAWAYTELGWGGYWAWDPVENASFMPWLSATAFLHSVIIQEKRQMLKVWNVSLILLTYVLAVFGTFLTRSGILSSIHTFTEGATGKWFLPFLALMVIGSFGLVAYRYDKLRSENQLDSLLSRESAFLANNVLFLAATFTVLLGTIWPIIQEAITGTRITVLAPYFNLVFVPIALALLVLAGLGPLISYRRMRPGSLLKLSRIPMAAGAVTIVALAAFGVRSVGALIAFGLCAFTAVAIGTEFARGSRIYRKGSKLSWPTSIAKTLTRNRRRYGGYVIHLGIVLIVIGFAGAAFKVERQTELQQGQPMTIGDYTLTYDELETFETTEKQVNAVTLTVARGGESVGVLRPQRNFHIAQQQTQSEVSIRTTPVEDLYVVVTAVDSDGSIVLRAFVNPLTWWIWAGAGVMAIGMSVILSGAADPVRRAVEVTRPLGPIREEPAVVQR